MAIHITPEMVEAVYNLLKTMPPFKRWGLPSSNKVEWIITRNKTYMGRCTSYSHTDQKFTLEISMVKCTNTQTLVETVAHEMIHMRQRIVRGFRTELGHGKDFQKMADQVCRKHGFNRDYF